MGGVWCRVGWLGFELSVSVFEHLHEATPTPRECEWRKGGEEGAGGGTIGRGEGEEGGGWEERESAPPGSATSVCVCVCVCAREIEREGEREGEQERKPEGEI